MRRQGPRSIREELKQARNNPVVASSTNRSLQTGYDETTEIPKKFPINSVLKAHHDTINNLSQQLNNIENKMNARFQELEKLIKSQKSS